MKIGFTGTQIGMTSYQKLKVQEFFAMWGEDIIEFHAGDCIGADAEAQTMAYELTRAQIYLHPPIKIVKRAFWNRPDRVTILEPKDYMERNMDIVIASQVMLATPKEKKEVIRSGTWSTIRRAREKERRLFIFYPECVQS